MKKKILSIVALASLMMLGGCGNKTSDVTTPNDTTKPTETSKQTETSKPTETPTEKPSTEAPTETAETRHSDYMTKQADGNADITIQGKVIHSVSYSGNTTCNIAVQEGIYGYWLNNVPKASVTVGKSYVFTGKGAAKKYPAINMKSGTVTETADIEITTLMVGDTANNYEASRDALMTIPEAGVVINSADATNFKYGFFVGEKQFYVTFNTSVIEADALKEKLAKAGEGSKIKKLSGIWYSEDTIQICNPDEIEIEAPNVASVTITAADDATSVQATGTLQLTASVAPAAALQDVVWSSEKTDIATVSETGLVTGIKEGTTKIFATAKGTEIKGEFNLTVTAAPSAPVESIAITAENGATGADINGTVNLTASVLPDNAPKTVTWSSSDDSIATVKDGVVTFVGDGDVIITASATDNSGKAATIKLSTEVANLKTAAEIADIISSLNNNGKTEEVSFRGVVTAFKDDKNFIMNDGTGIIQGYDFSKIPEGLKVGDTVLYKGKITKYNKLAEIINSDVTSMVISKKKVEGVPAEATEMTKDEITTLCGTSNFSKGQYIKFKNAKAVKSGTYTNLDIEGKTISVSMIGTKDFTLTLDTWGTFTAHVVNTTTFWIDSFTANEASAPTALTIEGKDTIAVGHSTSMTAKLIDDGTFKNYDDSVTWSVTNKDASITEALATISESGVLTAGEKEGIVIITAISVADTSIKATHEVTIASASTAKNYKLVKDIANISVGDKIVFAYDDPDSDKDFGMSTQNGKYRSVIDLTIANETIAEADGLVEFTIVAGYQDNTYAFFDGTNYLAYNTTGNDLNTESTVKDSSSFTVTISDAGIATIKNYKTPERFIKYNVNNPRFSCYKSGQKDISIFELVTQA